ncbi:MAG: PD-(D/E)XK nuclease family protein [Bacilli bacterium]|nr:PD-(D/E)XK nuclease family protein [Bacilli bacterium]
MTKTKLIIAPNYIKKRLLKEKENSNEINDLKIITREEFIKNVFFDYNEEAILYLMDNYVIRETNAKEIINCMYYIDEVKNNSKIDTLYNIKNELLNNNLLIINPLYNIFLKDKDIEIIDYKLDNLLKKGLDKYSYTIKENKDKNDNNTVLEFPTIEEEIDYVFHKIGDLITSGIDINKIKIINYSDRYSNVINKLSKFYNIPVSDTGYSVYSTMIGIDFLDKLKTSKSFNDAYKFISNKYTSESDQSINGIILNICNTYNKYLNKYSFKNILELVTNKILNTSIGINLQNKVELLPFKNYTFNDEYIFLIGFNQGELPTIYKNEDYLEDAEKDLIGMENSTIKNKTAKEEVIDFINKTKYLYMSYPLNHLEEKYYQSNLIAENNIYLAEKEIFTNSYSTLYSKIKLSRYIDDLVKFGINSKELSKYYSNYKIDYSTYNNSFTGIDSDLLLKLLNNKLVLSYSSINNYNKCQFRYYLENILKINKYEESFQQKIGNLFHYLLSICLDDNFDLDSEWNKYLKQYILSPKEEILLIKLKKELSFIINFVKKLHKDTGLTKHMLEQKISIDKSINNIEVRFTGIIDKLMYKNDLVALIDYKTGNPDINLGSVIYGIDMQLPIYWYLVVNSNLVKEPKFVGMYLQKVLSTEQKIDEEKTLEEQKENNLKLVGYSSSDIDRVQIFDPTYEDSIYIKSMKLTKDGRFNGYTKIINDEELNTLVDIIDNKINENRDNILKGEFNINPKQIGDDLVGCEYCKYRDICFRKNEDIVSLKKYKDLSYLGGEEDA